MRRAEGTFPGGRGARLFWQAWLPMGDARAALLVVHGLGEHGGRYGELAARFAARGYAVYALDHLGHGRSEGRRLYVERFEAFTAPLADFAGLVADREAGRPLFLVGHSMGGLIAALHLAAHQERYAGAVLSAPAVCPPEGLSPLQVFFGRILAAVLPRVWLTREDVQAVSRDPAVQAAYLADPLVCSGRITARLGAELLGAMDQLEAEAGRISLPLLILQGDADRIVDPAGARLLYDRVSSTDRTLLRYEGLFHEVFNEPERERVLGDLAAWLEARLSGRPA